MTAVAAKKPVARKTAASQKVVNAPEAVAQTESVTPVDPDVYVAPAALSEGFVSTGVVPLDRLSKRAVENLTELATEGNTDSARKHWIARLAQYGITVPFVPVVAPAEPVSV